MDEEKNTIKAYGRTYEMIEKGGEVSIKRFNEETKMWVTLTFTEDSDKDIEEIFKNILRKEYINSVVNSY